MQKIKTRKKEPKPNSMTTKLAKKNIEAASGGVAFSEKQGSRLFCEPPLTPTSSDVTI